MSMFNTGDILETIEMFTQDNLDVRTVTMGISLLDCIDPDPKKACENIYNKITTRAAKPTRGAARNTTLEAAAGTMVSLPRSLKKS